MEVQELLFWVVVGILIGAVIILVADKMLVSLVQVNVYVKSGEASSSGGTASGGTNPSTCYDGTDYGSCSLNKPQYCDDGNLIDKCTQCGCPSSGQICNPATDSCYTPSTQCPDGTAYNYCSDANEPSWCDSTGSLVPNQCGSAFHDCSCPSGSTCQSDGSCQSTSTCDSTCKAQSFASGTCESGSSFGGMLHVCGTKLCDETGSVVVLKSTQYDWNSMRHDFPSSEPRFDIGDLRNVTSHGGNAIELHKLPISLMMPTKGSVNTSWFVERLDKYVSWCEQTKIYCIISLPSMEEQYAPVPTWLLNGNPNTQAGWNQASIGFWNTSDTSFESNRQAIIQLFAFIANRYKNNKTVIFGLINEPFMQQINSMSSTVADHLSIPYSRVVERIIDNITATGANQPIFVDKPYIWFKASYKEPVNRNNMVWEDHAYIQIGGYPTDLAQWKTNVNGYVQQYVNTFNKPFYLGEYGILNYSSVSHENDQIAYWKENLTAEVNFLNTLPLAGYAWHEYPFLHGEWYDYSYGTFTQAESDWILQTVLGGSTSGSCQSGETSIGQDGCSSGLCCCLQTATCSCGSWTSGSCGAGSCSSNQRQQTRTCTPSGCSPSDGLGTSRCVADTSCGTTAQYQVSVDTSKVIGSNKLSLGTQIAFDQITEFTNNAAQQQLAKDANFKMIRFFDYHTQITPCRNSTNGYENAWNDATKNCSKWNWTNADAFVNKIYAAGAEPMVDLVHAGCNPMFDLPSGMTINSTTGLPNPDSYAAYAAAWVSHFKSKGYPWNQTRYYEIINEVEFYIFNCGSWTWNSASQTRTGYYMQLFNKASSAMRSVNPNIIIGFDYDTYSSVLDYWLANGGANLDSLNFHKYETNAIIGADGTVKGSGGYMTDQQLFDRVDTQYFGTWPLGRSVTDSQQYYYSKKGSLLPIINSESNLNSYTTTGTDPRTVQMTGAVWTALLLRRDILNGVSYNVYFTFDATKNYETNKAYKPDGGYGFGLINSDNNQPWYPYYVHKMIGPNIAVGDSIVNSSSNYANVSSIAWTHSGKLNIILIHRSTDTKTISLNGVTGTFNYQKIDNTYPFDNAQVQTGLTNAGDKITLNGYTVMLLTQTTQSYKIYPFNRYNEWYNSKVGTYTFGTDYVQEYAQHDNSAVSTYFPLMTYMSMFNPLIPLKGKHLYVDAECEMVSASLTPSTGTPWLRTAIVSVVNESTPVNGYSDLYMEFDYYHGSGTNPQGSPTGDFNWEQVPGFPFNPGTGFHNVTLDLTTAFVKYFGQAAYDSGQLWYISSTIELKNAQTTVRCKNFTVKEQITT